MRKWHLPLFSMLICGLLLVFGMTISLFTFNGEAAAQVFSTNTPRPPDLLEAEAEGASTDYILRIWRESDFFALLQSQIERLSDDDPDIAKSIRLTQYEIARRQPMSDVTPEQRRALLEQMLAAPVGVVDLRSFVRPYILEQMNANIALISTVSQTTFTIGDFLVQLAPLNLNGDDLNDAMIALRYPSDALTPEEFVYKDYILVVGTQTGEYTLPPMTPNIPAAPYDDIQDVTLVRVGDVNQDTIDEMVLTVNTGALNQEMLVYGWRNNSITNLILPGERVLLDELVAWPVAEADFVIRNFSTESERWQCFSSRQETWIWRANFYRPSGSQLPTPYQNADTIGCAIYENEPIFAQPPSTAIDLLNDIVKSPFDQQGVERGGMALAMLYLLNGQTSNAESQTSSLLPLTENNDWLSGQINAFTLAASNPNNTPVQVCAALIDENPAGACDIDQVLSRFFIENPIARDRDVASQLQALGLPVQEVLTVSQVGRVNREFVNFALPGASWWAFAPTDPVFYIPSPEEAPIGAASATTAMAAAQPQVMPLPVGVYDILIEGDSPIGVLTLIENFEQELPEGSTLSPEALYLQALSFDLTANLNQARSSYFNLWSTFPDTIWGQLAGAHLQPR